MNSIHFNLPSKNNLLPGSNKLKNCINYMLSKKLIIIAVVNLIMALAFFTVGLSLLSWPTVIPGAILLLITCCMATVYLLLRIQKLNKVSSPPLIFSLPQPIITQSIKIQNTAIPFSFQQYTKTIQQWFYKKKWSFESLHVSPSSILSDENEALTIKNNYNQISLTLVKHVNIAIPFNIAQDNPRIAIFNELDISLLKKTPISPLLTEANKNPYEILKLRPTHQKKIFINTHEAIQDTVNNECWTASIKNHHLFLPGDAISTPWRAKSPLPTGFIMPHTLIQILGPNLQENTNDISIINSQLNIVFKAYTQAFFQASLMGCTSIQLPLIGSLSSPQDKFTWELGCYIQLCKAINQLPKHHLINNITLINQNKKPLLNQIIIDFLIKIGEL
ncbi:hypothetical protein CLAVI_000197 [Candidatus Clavichlamydia salmonicola]|uniref:hypothetical protein n=1 Tax=Candidatus Clavichlamydia salmonicola TaxID=469812 RepID=UPI001891323D|nr:hypothetical protein [Candidatus Clavichlamydia salmonicola]MBF5050586.1 hypothetical protein [Candidatus Clavichlamydia salmonicola]